MNAVKYAEARNAAVTLHRKGDRIEVEVKDDGVGFDTNKVGRQHVESGGFELFSVRERLALLGLGGAAKTESRIGEESRIIMTAPLSTAGNPLPEKEIEHKGSIGR